ncbi:MAG TPA: M90 family metallopeptidase [Pirellulales bacterium]|nr:M90 family metallopeptidase [Pirellulales bacterium]
MFSWFRARHRQQLLREPFPAEWFSVLSQQVRHYRYLDAEKRARLQGCVQVMVAEKDWFGGSGFQLTDTMKITIAGYAAVMTLGLDEPYYFDRLKSIIVYSGAYMSHVSQYDLHPPLGSLGPRLGEAWHHGPVVLSWQEIAGAQKSRPGNNLVVHEFAHHVDGLDGSVDGTPAIVGREQSRTWYRVTETEYERICSEAARGEATLLDRYGASNRAEFFAVASECFFERPHALRERHPALYEVLSNFYCQDVAVWLPDAIDLQTPP